jgi:ubiquinone/menaquinone biosynthesis C-methylase UbiE
MSCKLGMVQEKKKAMIERYNSESYVSIYDNRYRTLQYIKFSHLLSKITNTNGLLLDYGAGTGLFLDFFLENMLAGSTKISYLPKLLPLIIGLDISIEMLRKFKEKLNKIPHSIQKNVQLICADGEHLPFRSAQFRNTICATALQNLPSPEVGLIEIKRILQKGGYLMLSYLKKSISESALINMLTKNFSEIHSIPVNEDVEESGRNPVEDYLFIAQI